MMTPEGAGMIATLSICLIVTAVGVLLSSTRPRLPLPPDPPRYRHEPIWRIQYAPPREPRAGGFVYAPASPTLTIGDAAAILDRQDWLDALRARRFSKPHIRLKVT